jgi:hypothetical protein
MQNNKLTTLIPSVIALCMGIVSIILLILNGSQETILILLAIAVLCLGFVGVNNYD